MAQWRHEGYQLVKTSINFSNLQLYDTGYPQYLFSLMKEYGIEAKYLEIEITESAYLTDKQETRDFIRQFTENGIGISIDDFGTGYSSISYLYMLPFSTLKLDKSLLDEYLETGDDRMIEIIIQMAHVRNCKVIAEGVEVEEQAKMLLEKDCDIIQGYLFGRPETSDAAAVRMDKITKK